MKVKEDNNGTVKLCLIENGDCFKHRGEYFCVLSTAIHDFAEVFFQVPTDQVRRLTQAGIFAFNITMNYIEQFNANMLVIPLERAIFCPYGAPE